VAAGSRVATSIAASAWLRSVPQAPVV